MSLTAANRKAKNRRQSKYVSTMQIKQKKYNKLILKNKHNNFGINR